MALLPLKLPIDLMQTKWKSILDPVISAPTATMSILQDIPLAVGVNVINHRLGQRMQGWILTDIQAPATIYRSAAFNDLTLTLHSSAVTTISLGVF